MMNNGEARRILLDIADQMPSDECADWIDAISLGIKAIDAQPKTGHWITDVYMFGRGRHTCSNCGKGQEYTTAFCSWCGADMRGENNGE